MDKKALKKLRKFIKEEVPAVAFEWEKYLASGMQLDSIGGYVNQEYAKETLKHMKDIVKGEAPRCNTVACIAGWAAVCHPKRFGIDKYDDLCYRKPNGRLDHEKTGEMAFAEAYDLTVHQASKVVFGFEEYENTKEGALQCLTDLLDGNIEEGEEEETD